MQTAERVALVTVEEYLAAEEQSDVREGVGQWYWHIFRTVAVPPLPLGRLVMEGRSPAVSGLTFTHRDADEKKFSALCAQRHYAKRESATFPVPKGRPTIAQPLMAGFTIRKHHKSRRDERIVNGF